jgi:mono/diheme cytochrome c family protein
MPKFDFSEKEARAIADYLFSMTLEYRIDSLPGEINWNLADKGKALWGQSRCSICHPANGVGGSFKEIYAPDLGFAGSKINRNWLYRWLKNPRSYFMQTKMPRFRFTDDQIWALVEFIMSEYIDWDYSSQYSKPVQLNIKSIQEGKELIQKNGCFGCHEVKGLEQMKPIGPFLRHDEVSYLKIGEIDNKVGAEISSIGNQPIERFDFGVMEEYIPNDRISYFQQKLKAPRSFRNDLIMPDYQFTEEEIKALTTLLLGFTDTDVPTRFKVPKVQNSFELNGKFAQIDEDVKCLNCHMINGKGEEFAPDLSIEGSKVQGQWLRQFLKQPDIIRPMLKQMPLFNLDHDQISFAQCSNKCHFLIWITIK